MVNVAILGFGVVGSGVLEVIENNADGICEKTGKRINVKYILDIRDFPDHPAAAKFTKQFDDILNDPTVSVVAEVIGGIEPSYTFTKKALQSGKNVVTSNKELVATKGAELLAVAKENGVQYMFEASVGGGIPALRPINQCLAANQITEVLGILNGTTNYILTKMIKEGKPFEAALGEAQKLGYAERDPSADVEGLDAGRKIAILASLISGYAVDPDKLLTEGITGITLEDVRCAESMGYVIKLIGLARQCGKRMFARVSPMLLPKDYPLSGIEDVFNGILVVGDAVGDVMFYGRGAGKLPTASAVVADIIDIAQYGGTGKFYWENSKDPDFLMDVSETSSKFFVRTTGLSKEAVLLLFGDVDFAAASQNGEVAFITPELSEQAFADICKNNAPHIISYIRTLI